MRFDLFVALFSVRRQRPLFFGEASPCSRVHWLEFVVGLVLGFLVFLGLWVVWSHDSGYSGLQCPSGQRDGQGGWSDPVRA